MNAGAVMLAELGAQALAVGRHEQRLVGCTQSQAGFVTSNFGVQYFIISTFIDLQFRGTAFFISFLFDR
jgi:hypothetical protein